ncbi:uncharacterized protein BDCG_04631 [Blastomyces dermatitidis ER-3]|uniref:Uncharacterized protein n=1 Tax=Ajellomyces dermatitidis (strain ER-3 / ATCC MYA-2586) TaxID=559297 RepID=A0ABP2EYZ6_AJEDR|nr:uncharacterized protein BDCG_04631 [Blastomyces dermatitidis ER-3]EEQ89511.2 hypothetical protein BDCG_04631 [Blastomyces dermatitidis ER-3]
MKEESISIRTKTTVTWTWTWTSIPTMDIPTPPPAPTPAGTVTAHQHPSFIAVRSLRVASARTQPVHTYLHTYIGRQRTKSPNPHTRASIPPRTRWITAGIPPNADNDHPFHGPASTRTEMYMYLNI